jgi:WXG100 family type VII secretion target
MLPTHFHYEKIKVDVSDLRSAADGYDQRAQDFSDKAAFARGELIRLGSEWLGAGADAFQLAGQKMAAKLEEAAGVAHAAARELRDIANRFEWVEREIADTFQQVY